MDQAKQIFEKAAPRFGWLEGGGALLCFCLTEVHDLLSWRFSAGFSLDLIQRKVLRFFFCFI